MWPLFLLLTLMIPTTSSAQTRGSLLDDPNFLRNLGIDEESDTTTPPCATCGMEENGPNLVRFARDRRNGFTLLQNENIQGTSCVSNRYYFTDTPANRTFSGFSFCQNSGRMTRDLWFVSVDGSREATYMYFQDNTHTLDSQNEKVAVVMLPRVTIPNVRVVGNQLHVTLSTGELVVLDATTKARISGPMSFGPLSPRNAVTPYTYTGRAIQISSQHNQRMPFEAGAASTVRVRQGNLECSVNRDVLFNASGSTKQVSDSAMVTVINQHCTPRPARPFTLP